MSGAFYKKLPHTLGTTESTRPISLTTGLGRLRVIAKLGAGGMGVVYLAEDKTLNRQVAIKGLPDAFTGDPERLARFEREAKLLASLNHPNIHPLRPGWMESRIPP